MSVALALSETVVAAKGGDQTAWNTLVERFMPLVMSVSRRYRLSAEDAADVNQTLWLRLVEHLDEIRDPRALPGWIVTTTRNEAMRLLKVRSRVQPVDPMDTMAVLGDDAPEVDEDLLRAELHQALRDGLRELRPRSREFLVLLMADPPPSYDEVSRRLQMPKGSIGPTRARCLAELRKTAPMRSFLAAHDAMLGR